MEIGWDKILLLVLTTLLAVLSRQILEILDRRRSRKSLAAAFAGEINAILQLGEMVKPYMTMAEYLEQLRTMDDESRWTEVALPFVIRDIKFEDVYLKNAEKIGSLPKEISEDLARFYTFLFNLRGDLKAVEDGSYDNRGRLAKIRLVEENMKLWNTLEGIGKSLVPRLRKV